MSSVGLLLIGVALVLIALLVPMEQTLYVILLVVGILVALWGLFGVIQSRGRV